MEAIEGRRQCGGEETWRECIRGEFRGRGGGGGEGEGVIILNLN